MVVGDEVEQVFVDRGHGLERRTDQTGMSPRMSCSPSVPLKPRTALCPATGRGI